MRVGKKLGSLLLVLAMVLSMVPATPISAAEITEASEIVGVKCDTVYTQGIDAIYAMVDIQGTRQKVETYDLSKADFEVELYFNDGSTQWCSKAELEATGIPVEASTNWLTNPWTPGTCTFTMLWNGLPAQIQVTLEENPVVSVELDTSTQYVGNTAVVEHPDGSSWVGYDPFEGNPEMRVKYADGSEESFGVGDRYDFHPGHEIWFDLDETQGDWTAGTYQVSATYLGVPFTFEMNLTARPFESFYVTYGGSFYEGMTTTLWDEDAQMNYEGYDLWDRSPQFGLEHADGSQSGPFWNWELVDMYGYGMDIVSDQSPTNTWGAGEHFFTVKCVPLGLEAQVSVYINENPVAAITATTDDSFMEGETSLFYDAVTGGEIEGYNPYNLNIQYTITTTSGDVLGPFDKDALYSIYSNDVVLTTTQGTQAWGVGTHSVTVEFMGATTTVDVEVQANPVKSISMADITLRKNLDKVWHGGWDDATQQEITFWGYNPFENDPQVTVTYADGTTETLSISQLEGDCGWDYDWFGTGSWTVGQTYQAAFTYNGRTAKVNVRIVDDGLTGIKFSDTSVVYSSAWENGYWDEQTQQFLTYRCYDSAPSNMTVTLTFADGTTQELYWSELRDTVAYYDIIDGQSSANEWQIGSVNQVKIRLAGMEVSYNVTVEDDRVSAVSVEGEVTLYEDISNYDHNVRYSDKLVATLTRANGAKTKMLLSELFWSGMEVQLTCDTVGEGSVLAVGKHTYTLTVDGKSTTFTVEVVENTVENIELVLDQPLVEGLHGYEEYYLDDNDQEQSFFFYDINGVGHRFKVTFTDGTTKTMDAWQMEQFFGESPYCYVIQDPENTLKVGQNTVKAYIYEKQYSATLTVVESPIVSITVTPVELLENNGGWTNVETDEQGNDVPWYWYSLDYSKLELTVKFADGSQQTLQAWESLLGGELMYYLYVEDDQYENHWQAGKTYNLEGHLGTMTFDVPVKILKNEITKVEVTATEKLVRGLHERYMEDGVNSNVFDLTMTKPVFKLTFADGTTKSYTYRELMEVYPNGEVHLSTEHYIENPKVGKNTTDMCVLGLYVTYEFEIIENPVKTITAKPTVKLEEGYAGTEAVWNENGTEYVLANAYHFQDTMPLFTVTFTDGTVKEYLGCEALYQACGKQVMSIGYQTPDDLYKVGSNKATLWAWGHEVEYSIEIVEPANPVKKITAKAVDTLYENDHTYGYTGYTYLNILEVTIEFADGTVISGMADKLFPTSQRTRLQFRDSQDDGERWGLGKHTVTVEYQGASTTCQVEVVANPYTALAIAGGETGLDLILTKADGSKETFKGTAFFALSVEDDFYVGTLTTDKGDLIIYVQMDGDGIQYVEYLGLRSNSLDKGLWIKTQAAVESIGVTPEITVGDLDAMVNSVLTEEEQALSGNRVWMTAEDITENVPEADQAAVDSALEQLKDYEQALVLDLNMFKIVESGLATEVSQLSGKITVTVALPRELCKEGVSFKVIRVHDGVAEVLDTVVDLVNCTVTFETDRFSTYSVASSTPASNPVPPADPTPETPPADTPPTGDEMPLVLLAMLALVSAAALVLLKKKRA